MALEIGTNPMDMDAIAARLVADFGDELADVRVQEPDTVVARCDRAPRSRTSRGASRPTPRSATRRSTSSPASTRCQHIESVYHVYSWKTNTYLELHVELSRAKAEVDTVTDVWPAADWHEREAWDMVGIRYLGHPDLRRILLKDDFVGHPLRKDYVDLIENHPHV